MSDLWRQTIVEAFQATMRRMAEFLPNLLAMITLLILGLVAAWAMQAMLVRVLKAVKFDTLCEQWGVSATLSKGGIQRPGSELAGRLVFWLIFLVVTFMAVDALDLEATTNFMTVLLIFLPHFFAAVLLLFVGWLLANFFAEAALIGLVNAQIQEARPLANLIRWGILIFTAAMVLTQLGIAREIVIAAFSITFGGVVLALSIALGLGGRGIAKDLLERRLLQKGSSEEKDISHL